MDSVKRGDIVAIVQPGAYEPRPALVIQSDLFHVHPSVTILPLTSTLREAPLFRLRVEPSPQNGLRVTSEIMIDKATAVPREKAGKIFGQLEEERLRETERLLLYGWVLPESCGSFPAQRLCLRLPPKGQKVTAREFFRMPIRNKAYKFILLIKLSCRAKYESRIAPPSQVVIEISRHGLEWTNPPTWH